MSIKSAAIPRLHMGESVDMPGDLEEPGSGRDEDFVPGELHRRPDSQVEELGSGRDAGYREGEATKVREGIMNLVVKILRITDLDSDLDRSIEQALTEAGDEAPGAKGDDEVDEADDRSQSRDEDVEERSERGRGDSSVNGGGYRAASDHTDSQRSHASEKPSFGMYVEAVVRDQTRKTARYKKFIGESVVDVMEEMPAISLKDWLSDLQLKAWKVSINPETGVEEEELVGQCTVVVGHLMGQVQYMHIYGEKQLELVRLPPPEEKKDVDREEEEEEEPESPHKPEPTFTGNIFLKIIGVQVEASDTQRLIDPTPPPPQLPSYTIPASISPPEYSDPRLVVKPAFGLLKGQDDTFKFVGLPPPVGVLRVTVLAASDLKPVAGTGRRSTLAQVSVGSDVRTTKIVEDSLNPVFNTELSSFEVKDRRDELVIKLMSTYPLRECVGEYRSSVALMCDGLSHELKCDLGPEQGSKARGITGSIHFVTQFIKDSGGGPKSTVDFVKDHRLHRLFEHLMALVIYHRPENPRAFLAAHLEDLITRRISCPQPAEFFNDENMSALFSVLDPTGSGLVTFRQFQTVASQLSAEELEMVFSDHVLNSTMELDKFVTGTMNVLAGKRLTASFRSR